MLGNGDERDRSGIKSLDQFGEVCERAGEAVDLVDDYHVDLAGLDIGQQLFECGSVQVAAGIGGVVIMLGEGSPSLRGLTLYIGLAGVSLGIERIEFQRKAAFRGFTGIDGATQKFGFAPS